MIESKKYLLTESEKDHIFKLIKKQLKTAKSYKDSPALEYLLQCREFTRFAIMSKDEEQQINRNRIKESKNV